MKLCGWEASRAPKKATLVPALSADALDGLRRILPDIEEEEDGGIEEAIRLLESDGHESNNAWSGCPMCRTLQILEDLS